MVKKVVEKKKASKKKTTPVKVIKKTVTITTTPHKSKTKPKKKITKKRKPTMKTPKISKDDTKLGRVLIENFIGLQKVMVNLSVKFDDLSNKISKLLELFEISAKALAEKDLTVEKTARDDTQIMKEMGNLSEQNKVIARGLTLMHNKLSEEPGHPIERQPQMPFPIPSRNSPMQHPMKRPTANPEKRVAPNKGPIEGYQKSIASEPFKKLPT